MARKNRSNYDTDNIDMTPTYNKDRPIYEVKSAGGSTSLTWTTSLDEILETLNKAGSGAILFRINPANSVKTRLGVSNKPSLYTTPYMDTRERRILSKGINIL